MEEWPYRFVVAHLFDHTNTLLGIALQTKLAEEISRKGKSIKDFLERAMRRPSKTDMLQCSILKGKSKGTFSSELGKWGFIFVHIIAPIDQFFYFFYCLYILGLLPFIYCHMSQLRTNRISQAPPASSSWVRSLSSHFLFPTF